MTTECDHKQNAQITMPSRTGAQSNAVPVIWCRKCGSLWLPRLPSFDRAFETHTATLCTAPIDGIGNVNGYWIHPGVGAIVRPVMG